MDGKKIARGRMARRLLQTFEALQATHAAVCDVIVQELAIANKGAKQNG